ncbi:MAG: P-loop NTPase fold protein [Cyanobacteria bacterium J06635_10]
MVNHLRTFACFVLVTLVLLKSVQVISSQVDRSKKDKQNIAQKDRKSENEPRVLDLAFVSLICALFSFLVIDTYISYFDVSVSGSTILFTTFLTLIVSLPVFGMCFLNRTELAMGTGAAIILVILDLATTRSFLWLPICITVFLIFMFYIYEFGSPFDRGIPKHHKIITTIILLMVILIASSKLGNNFIQLLNDDKKTPDISTVKEDVEYFKQLNDNTKKKYYQGFSEIEIENSYSARYRDTLEKIDVQREAIFSSENPEQINQELSSEDNFLRQLLDSNSASEYNPFGNRNSAYNFTNLIRILTNFRELDFEDKEKYLLRRLDWIHPVSPPDTTSPYIDLPGNSSQERLLTLSNSRICNALFQQPNLSKELLASSDLEYDSTILDIFRRQGGVNEFYDTTSDLIEDVLPLGRSSNREKTECIWKEAFSNLGSEAFVRDLKEQLALPVDEESYLAFSEYSIFSQSILAKDFSKAKVNLLKRLFDNFEELPPKSQSAFIYYFINYSYEIEGNITGESNYRTFLNYLSKVDLNGINAQSDVVEIKELLFDNAEVGESTDAEQNNTPNTAEEGDLGDSNAVLTLEKLIPTLGTGSRSEIRQLFSTETGDFPIYHLLTNEVKDFVVDVNDSLSANERAEVFQVLKNPVKKSIEYFGGRQFYSLNSNEENTDIKTTSSQVLQGFLNLSEEERENYLSAIAISLYKTEGEFSHDIFGLITTQAFSQNPFWGAIVASLFQLPAILVTSTVATYFGQRLSAQENLNQLMIDEKHKFYENSYKIGITDILRGRNKTIAELRKLAGRGWGSIAIVGRRGIGKTRILYELISTESIDRNTIVSSWVSAPTKFDETEFVESVLESIVNSIEDTISQRLGVKSLEVRRLETNQAITSIVVYVIVFTLALATFSIFITNTVSDQVVQTLLPVALLAFVSFILILYHVTKLQPVNLSSWLERDRTANPQTALLYREMRRVRSFLDNRRNYSNIFQQISSANYIKISLIVFIAVFLLSASNLFAIFMQFIILGAPLDFLKVDNISPVKLLIFLSIAILFIITIILLFTREVAKVRGYTLISLIAEYRNFLQKVVHRIRMGALGELEDESFEIIVCIDELDKIVNQADLRDFIRRIKVIFELPGVYYYLSLSEDSLRAFYLGTAEGKNEIDSAFDHIIYIPPVNCDLGEEIAEIYFQNHHHGSWHPRLARSIAAASYGVPRDIIRRCDELIAEEDLDRLSPSYVSNRLRVNLAKLAYAEERISKAESLQFTSRDPEEVLNAVPTFFQKDFLDSKSSKVGLAIWLLAILAIASDQAIDEQWLQISEQLRDVGYRISDEDTESLLNELAEAQKEILLP